MAVFASYRLAGILSSLVPGAFSLPPLNCRYGSTSGPNLASIWYLAGFLQAWLGRRTILEDWNAENICTSLCTKLCFLCRASRVLQVQVSQLFRPRYRSCICPIRIPNVFCASSGKRSSPESRWILRVAIVNVPEDVAKWWLVW